MTRALEKFELPSILVCEEVDSFKLRFNFYIRDHLKP